MRKWLVGSVIIILFVMVNCGDGGSKKNRDINSDTLDNIVDSSNVKDKGHVRVSLIIKNNKSDNRKMKSRIENITAITLDVNSSKLFYVKDLEFTKQGSSWEIDLPFMPVDKNLTFNAKGYNSDSSLIYGGSTTVAITPNQNDITLELSAIKDTKRDLPTVENIAIYKGIDNTRLSFKVLNRNRDELTYQVVPIDNNGSFNPNEGSILFNTDRELLNVIYTEPQIAGTFKNSITLTNTNEDKFISIFTIYVSETKEVNVTLNIAPNIDSLEVTNEDENLTIKANVTDDKNNSSSLNYLWEIMDGDVIMENNHTKNPIKITDYDENDTLKIKLTVFDPQGASSSVLYTIDGRYTNEVPEEFEFIFLSHYSTGDELWKVKKDKSTELIRTFNSTGKNGINLNFNIPKIGDYYYFVANTSTSGKELWRSDGTNDGTFMIKDIVTGEVGSNPKHLTVVNDTLYFTANDGGSGQELWKTDGSEKTTFMVKDIRQGTGDSNPTQLINLHGVLIFVANDGSHQEELWKSDGTSAGTALIKDIYSGVSSNPSNLTYNKSKNIIYFIANDGTHGRELWRCDGTSRGTTMVKDIFSGTSNSNIAYLESIDGILYFRASDRDIKYKINDGTNQPSNFKTVENSELWRSNGVAKGTVMIKDIKGITTNHTTPASTPSYMINVNGTLYFSAYTDSGVELWRSNGTTIGTKRVEDINPGGKGSHPKNMISFGGKLYFSATEGSLGSELWVSDGTSSNNEATDGTFLIKDIAPGSLGSDIKNIRNINQTLYFEADEGESGNRNQLWMSDGSEDGTIKIFEKS